MKKKVLILITILAIGYVYGGGTIIVTQGDCCGGGSGGGVAEGVGIYHAKALNMLSNDDDSTIVDGGVADRNTLKDLGAYSYTMQRQGSNGNFSTNIIDYYGSGIIGNIYSTASSNIYNVITESNGGSIYNSSEGQYNITALTVDTSSYNFVTTDNNVNSGIQANNNLYYKMQMSTDDLLNDNLLLIGLTDSKASLQYSKPIAYNYAPETEIAATSGSAYVAYNYAGDPLIAGNPAFVRVNYTGTGENVQIVNVNGYYELSESGTHYFHNYADTITAIFNGDIVCTGVNIPSEEKTKTDIKDVKLSSIYSLTPKSFEYDYSYKYDTIYNYDTTVSYKNRIEYRKEYEEKNPQILPFAKPIQWIKDKKGNEYRYVPVAIFDVKKSIKSIEEKKYSAGKHYGFLASDVESVLPEAITIDAKGNKYINYTTLSVATIATIKEQQILIEDLLRRIEILEKK